MRRREGDGVRWWLERGRLLHRDTDRQSQPALALRWVSRGSAEQTMPRVRELVDALELDAVWSMVPTLGYQVYGSYAGAENDAGPWTEELFERVAARVSAPDGQGVTLSWQIPDLASPGATGEFVGITLSASAAGAYPVDPDSAAWEWALHAGPDAFPGRLLDRAADGWLRAMGLIARWPEVTWGAVLYDVDYINAPTPFERYFSSPVEPSATTGLVRGYYWANLLTEGHLAAYADAQDLAETCAAAGIVYTPVQDRDAAVVSCAHPVSRFDDEQLKLMRDVLSPVLPKARYVWYEGPALRVIKEQDTAFRRIPPEIKMPWFDDDPPIARAAGGRRQLVPDEDR